MQIIASAWVRSQPTSCCSIDFHRYVYEGTFVGMLAYVVIRDLLSPFFEVTGNTRRAGHASHIGRLGHRELINGRKLLKRPDLESEPVASEDSFPQAGLVSAV